MLPRVSFSGIYGGKTTVLAEEPARARQHDALRRCVRTPRGFFPSCELAARAHGMPVERVLQRILAHSPGWKFD